MDGRTNAAAATRSNKRQLGEPVMAGGKAGNTLYAPRTERPMVPVYCIWEVTRFSTC